MGGAIRRFVPVSWALDGVRALFCILELGAEKRGLIHLEKGIMLENRVELNALTPPAGISAQLRVGVH